MWSPDSDRDVPLRAIAGALVLGADHPVTAAEVHQVVETVETLRRAQSADAPDVTDAELEAAQAEAAGLKICTLGRRILRCETAPLAALAALMYAAGEF